jgi:hypothetical protein
MDELGMRKISTKMVPQILTDDHEQPTLHISSDLSHDADISDRVITGEGTRYLQ